MRLLLWLAAGLMLIGCASAKAEETAMEWRLVIHGGAGVILKENLTADQEAELRAGLEVALNAGAAVLSSGGSSLDAVEAAIISLEDNPLFNAGRGAVYTAAYEHELDAAIMDGRDRNAGAVAGLTTVKNPIRAARAVMEQSEHVMFAGPGADQFAASADLDLVENSYFNTPRRLESLERVLESRKRTSAEKTGTVGAVAIDSQGNLAGGTSTGGMTAKAAGRVGDVPLIGAATYAQNGVCAISSTGHGEYFIRVAVAKAICARRELLGESLDAASQIVLNEVAALGGDGGVIALDESGAYSFVFNTPGMYRGVVDAEGRQTAIFGEE